MAKIKCPECGATDRFYITANCFIEVNGETGYVEDHEGFKWEGTAPCTCAECYYEGYYQDFKVYEED